MNLKQTVTVSSQVLAQVVSGETVLLDLESENCFSLDEVGTRIWQLLQENTDLQTVFECLLQEYDVESNRLERDLNELVEALVKAGLITLKTPE